jgi:hypothetical protein
MRVKNEDEEGYSMCDVGGKGGPGRFGSILFWLCGVVHIIISSLS